MKEIVYQLGCRQYIFNSETDLQKAISLYAHFPKGFMEFETEMKNKRIEFKYYNPCSI